MTERDAFIAAIAADPAADAPRLVFADWLDERGETARAGFVRDQVQLAKLRPGGDEYRALFRRTADTLKANLPAWIQDVCEAFGQPTEWKPVPRPGRGLAVSLNEPTIEQFQAGKLYGLRAVEFARGFIDWTDVDLTRVRDRSQLDQLFRQQPVRRLFGGFPQSVGEWRRLTTPSLGRVNTLTLFGGVGEEVAAAVLGDPCWSGVTRLWLGPIDRTGVRQLCAVPLAKRLVSLRVPFLADNLSQLSRFPVDDRLQEFVLERPAGYDPRPLPVPGWDLLPAVPFRPTLKRLNITDCRMCDRGLATFARGDVWMRLRALVLDRNRFGDPGWRDFVRSRRTPELRLLSASRNVVTGDGAGRLGQSPLAETLEYVDLRGNRIDGKGAVTLARSLAGGPLRRLLLAGNPIGAREAAMVRQVLGLRVDVGG